MTALGKNVHIFARPHRRQELIWCFDTVLGCGPVASIDRPGTNCHELQRLSGFARWPRGVGVQTLRAEARAA